MTQTSSDILKGLLNETGLEWLFDSPPGEENAILQARLSQLGNVVREYRKRYNDDAAPTVEMLKAEEIKSPAKVTAFLQAFAGPSRTFEMLVMVWRILRGDKIKEIHMDYELEKRFKLRVKLVRTDGGNELPPDEFESEDIWDAILLRHLAIIKTTGGWQPAPAQIDKPVFFGFRPLRLNDCE